MPLNGGTGAVCADSSLVGDRRNQCGWFNDCDEERFFRRLEKRGLTHMPGFTPARTRYQLAGKLTMKPRTMPICIMNQ